MKQAFENSQKIAEDESLILRLLNEFYKHYALHPNSYKQFVIDEAKQKPFTALAKALRKNPLFALKYSILSVLTKLYTKLTTLISSQKPS